MHRDACVFLLSVVTANAQSPDPVPAPLVPSQLRCEYRDQPTGVDLPAPRLSWVLTTDDASRGRRQTQWRIQVAGDVAALRDGRAGHWDSGYVAGEASAQHAYAGAPLRSREAVWWRVRVRDEAGREGPWSEPSSFVMGVLRPEEWTAHWIGAFAAVPPAAPIGYHAGETNDVDETKWVGVDLGEALPIDRVVLVPVRDHLGHDLFGFPVRFAVEVADEPTFAAPVRLFDQLQADFDPAALRLPPGAQAGPGDHDCVLPGHGVRARFLRVRATRLFRSQRQTACFALAELVVECGGRNAARGRPVLAKDTVEHSGWQAAALVDGVAGDDEPATLLLRQEFTPRLPVTRAVVHVCGLGQYELTVDGVPVSRDWLLPGWTQYRKTCLYDTFDLTAALAGAAPTPHCLGLHLGGGMYDMHLDRRGGQQPNATGPLQAILELHLDLADGSHQVVGTDGTWRWHPGAESYCGVFGGEDHDARRDPAGWRQPGAGLTGWQAVRELPGPGGRLYGLSRSAPPVRTIAVHGAVATTTPRPGVLVLDLGQNASWVPEITVQGPAGAAVQLWPAEILKADGTVEQKTMREGKRCTYTLRGGAAETWHPAFWYCGARYWQLQAYGPDGAPLPAAALLRDFRAHLVHSASAPAGSFTCSNELFVRTRELIEWALRSNMVSLITDCPHREKSGWLEQIHLVAPGMLSTFDMMPLLQKTMSDMRDAQQDDGMVPTTAPEYFFYEQGFRHSIEWGGAMFYLPRLIRSWYGDAAFTAEYYPVMQRYLGWLQRQAVDGILDGGLGDWDGGFDQRTPIPLTGTAYYHLAIVTLAQCARDLGKDAEAARWEALAAQVAAKFNAKWLDPATGRYATGSQASQAIALDLGLCPPAQREAAFARLLDDVAAGGGAVRCGEIGHPSVLRALADGGRSDVVFAMHSQSERPGYGWLLRHGATALTESWDLRPISHNHFMLGHILEWFYRDVAGLRPDPAHPGFAHCTVRPTVVGDLTWARAHYDSIRGRIEVDWRQDGDRMRLDLVVPPNSSADVELPAATPDVVTEGGRPAAAAAGVQSLGVRQGRAAFAIGSGRYAFALPWPRSSAAK